MQYSPVTEVRPDPPTPWSLSFSDGSNFTNGVWYAPEVNEVPYRVFPAPKIRAWKTPPARYPKSFKQVSRDREIKMTDYSIGEVKENWHLARVKRTDGIYQRTTKVGCVNDRPELVFVGGYFQKTTYVDQYDLGRASESFPSFEYSNRVTEEDVELALNDLKASVISKSFSGFDLLTELGEFPETLKLLKDLFLAALRPLQGIKKLQERYKKARDRGKSHSQAHADIASAWMQYRYGIMPIVYSIQDLIELLDKGFDEFKTDRDFTVLNNEVSSLTHPPVTHISVIRAEQIRVGVVGKARYSTTKLRLMDLISTNIFQTAWELIPLSFVIDWFINVGDVIFASTSTYADLAEERSFCYSIKRTTTEKHVLRWNFDDSRTLSVTHKYTPCYGKHEISDVLFAQMPALSMGSALLYERTEESYERVVFRPTDSVSLELNPHLNWMRMLDGYALSFKPILKNLKKLK